MIIVRVLVVLILAVMPLDCTSAANPCEPSPCGANSVCHVVNEYAVCSCRAGYLGAPPACRLECAHDSECEECVVNSDCRSYKACIDHKCKDPCPYSCGFNARCDVVRHHPICTCPENLPEGDPFIRCSKKSSTVNPCVPSPCGANSVCHVVANEYAACSCRIGNLGEHDSECHECVVNSDCSNYEACIDHKCKDPCLHSCGLDARCDVVRHHPICACPEHLPEGDPFIRCSKKHNKTNDESSERVEPNVVLMSLVILMSIAVVLGFFIIIYLKKCHRLKSNTEEPAQVYVPRNRFYVNLLFREECQREIYEREHIYEQID